MAIPRIIGLLVYMKGGPYFGQCPRRVSDFSRTVGSKVWVGALSGLEVFGLLSAVCRQGLLVHSVHTPFDLESGTQENTGNILKLPESAVLIIEGIFGLHPKFLAAFEDVSLFKVAGHDIQAVYAALA